MCTATQLTSENFYLSWLRYWNLTRQEISIYLMHNDVYHIILYNLCMFESFIIKALLFPKNEGCFAFEQITG